MLCMSSRIPPIGERPTRDWCIFCNDNDIFRWCYRGSIGLACPCEMVARVSIQVHAVSTVFRTFPCGLQPHAGMGRAPLWCTMSAVEVAAVHSCIRIVRPRQVAVRSATNNIRRFVSFRNGVAFCYSRARTLSSRTQDRFYLQRCVSRSSR